MKTQTPIKIKCFILLSLLLLLLSCKTTTSSVQQASIGTPPPPTTPNYYQDIFSADTFGKQIRYEVKTDFWTSTDEEYVVKTARIALHHAFLKTFEGLSAPAAHGEEGGPSLTDTLKTNVTESMLTHFVKTLNVFKIANGTFQYDIYFTPVKDSPHSLNHQFSTNQLIQLKENETLSQSLANESDFSPTQSIVDAPKHFPAEALNNQDYTYVGGSISLWFKLLDLRWNPLRPIPRTKKNAIKGFARYRRYFVMNHQGAPVKVGDLAYNSKLDLKQGAKHAFVTVDVYKSFNLSNLKPQLDKLVINFGKVGHPLDHRGGVIPRFLRLGAPKDKSTATMEITGTFKDGTETYNFSGDLGKIEWDLVKKEFNGNASLLNLDVKRAGSTSFSSVDEELTSAASTIRQSIIEKHSKLLISQFKLDRFHKDLNLDQ